jgi:16S rRNA (adenine1518-N6/adenine1519-N6)-dimethyltransferase
MNRGGFSKEEPEKLWMDKKLGQNMLLDESVASMEASFGKGKCVVELGAGLGMLTKQLCKEAKRVIAIEKDKRLFDVLKSQVAYGNLELINADFFKLDDSVTKGAEIMISNVPYNLSSRTVYWLQERGIPAILCLQKEFVEHMLAKANESSYSKLSVITSIYFKAELLREVKAGSFFPSPKVDSQVIKLDPTGRALAAGELKVLSLLMEHKKKTLKNALVDSSSELSIEKNEARGIGREDVQAASRADSPCSADHI